jgi:predicted transcriptional regulator
MSKSTSIKLRDGLDERLRAVAEREHLTANKLMNEAISEYVDRKERRAAYLAEVEERYREMRETGLHVTQEDADQWIDGLLRGENPPLPKPHT